ncbi:MAG TPA: hypothetical protein VEW08_06105 [Steroidobacteraceae bacterium]|nr:hypothetical protein [Steroidobacteraceae bacterium]
MFDEATDEPHDIDGFRRYTVGVLNDEPEIQLAQRAVNAAYYFLVGVGDAENAPAVASFCVENSGEETRNPLNAWSLGPRNELLHTFNAGTRVGADRVHRNSSFTGGRENERSSFYALLPQVFLSSNQCLAIDQRKTELVLIAMGSAFAFVVI